MPRKKEKTNANTPKEFLTWTTIMDDALVDAFMHQYNLGNKVGGNFTTKAYDNIVNELVEKIGMEVDKEKIKNRWKTLKKNFSQAYDIFKNGLSGFSWNPSTKLWNAEPEVWAKLIQAKPKAKTWMTTPLPNYEKMVVLYGNDIDSETASERRKRRSSTIEGDFMDTIEGIGHLVSQNDDTLEDVGCFDIELLTCPEGHSRTPSQATTSGTSKKPKKSREKEKEKDKGVEGIKIAIEQLIEAIKERNTLLRKQPQISGREIWKLMMDLGFESHLMPTIYCNLVNDADKLRAILECPLEYRREVILHLVYGNGTSNLPGS